VADSTLPHGVICYEQDRPVGWCAIAPRANYPRLLSMRAAAATQDEDGLWSVTCFVVRVGHRRQGLAAELLAGAVDLARRQGARTIEAYPVDPSVRPSGSAGLYPGPLSVYLAAGFTEVARTSPSRSIVRLDVGGSSQRSGVASAEFAACTAAPERTNSTAASISGER
jgi:GNAT superfamily N-acetyltransferase